jgi:hypothetical protein
MRLSILIPIIFYDTVISVIVRPISIGLRFDDGGAICGREINPNIMM